MIAFQTKSRSPNKPSKSEGSGYEATRWEVMKVVSSELIHFTLYAFMV